MFKYISQVFALENGLSQATKTFKTEQQRNGRIFSGCLSSNSYQLSSLSLQTQILEIARLQKLLL